MTKQLLAAAAAFALLSGVAMAQTYETTTSRTTTVAPTPTIPVPSDSYTQTRTESHVAPSGAAVQTQQTYKSDLSGTAASSEQKVVRPDGSTEVTTSKQWSNSVNLPPPAPTPVPIAPATSYTTTTTTVR